MSTETKSEIGKIAQYLVEEQKLDIGCLYECKSATSQAAMKILRAYKPQADKLPNWDSAVKGKLSFVALKGTQLRKTGGEVIRRVIGQNKEEYFTITLYMGALKVLRLPKIFAKEVQEIGLGYALKEVPTAKGKVALPILSNGKAVNHVSYKKQLGEFATLSQADKVEKAEVKEEPKKPSKPSKKAKAKKTLKKSKKPSTVKAEPAKAETEKVS
jgi:hypothetical protein